MCDCFHLAFPNWHAASSGTGAGRRLRAPEPGTEDDSIWDEPPQFTEGERPRPQGSSPVEEYPETDKYADSEKECEAEHDPHHKSGSGKKTKKSGLGSMFEKRSTPKMSKLKEVPSPESGVIVKTATDGCAEGLIYGGGGKEGIFIKAVIPESPASKSLKLKEGDQLLSATVYFDNVSYEDAIQILEHAQAYKVKLCLKRKPDITETEPAIESDIIPEDDLYAPEMREPGKTKRRGDARISWPKFPSFGKGRKSRFTRSHSSSEADEQRKLELSPTTSDTDSPIKSQDALKGKKKHKIKLSGLTKRGRISSSEDQDTDAPTSGQISGNILQTHEESDMLSTPEVYVTENLKLVEDLRDPKNDQNLTEPQTVQHKVELITIGSTLKTEDLTVALADQESPSGIKSTDEKKKKKERSELKMNILEKDKLHKKDANAKSSPKRLKTLGASIEIADKPENEKSDVTPHTNLQGDQLALDANTQIISSRSPRQIKMSVPKVELDVYDVTLIQKSPQKGEEKTKKGKNIKQKQDTKTGPTFKLPKIGFSDIATEETIQKVHLNVEERPINIQQLTTEGSEVKEDPYERLSKSSLSQTKLPKREDIEIPGMEDVSMGATAKRIKEPKTVYMGHHEEIQAETVQLSIDVDSVKEAVSKLPGFKLPKVDMSGVPIPEEITVIDANAQRISVKTPTKVVDTKTKQEEHFPKFDITASPEISKTTFKLPKITPADLTSETTVDLKKPEKKYRTEAKQSDKEIKTEVYEGEHNIIPGKESVQEAAILQAQETEKAQGKEGMTFEYESAATLSSKESDKKSKKARITTPRFGIEKPDIKIPDIGIHLPKQIIPEQKRDNIKGERTIFLQEVCQMSKTETRKDKGQIGGVISDVKIPEIDCIEYIDSVSALPAKKDGGIELTGFGVNIDAAKPKADILFPELSGDAEEHTIKLPKFGEITGDISVNVPDADKDIHGGEIKSLDKEEKGSKFKMPNLDISMPKVKEPKSDLSLSNKDVDVTLPEAKAEVKLPDVPEVDLTLENVYEIPEMEIRPLQTEHELEQESKFKMPKFGIKTPKLKGPEFDLSLSKKDVDVKLPEAKAKVKLPDVELKEPSAEIEIKAPEIKVVTKDTEGSPSKFKMPTFKLPKFGVGPPSATIEVPNKDIQIDGTDFKIHEEVYAVGPSVDIKTTGNEHEEKGSKLKMPHLGFSLPKVKGPQIDLSLAKKDVDVTLPETNAEVKLPETPKVNVGLGKPDVSLPEVKLEVKNPELEIKPLHSEVEFDEQGSKFKMPKFGMSVPKVKGPELHFSLSKKDGDVTLQEATAEVQIPEVELKELSAKVESKTPEIKVMTKGRKGSPSKFKMPTFKLPKFGVATPYISVEVLDMDKDVNINGADINIPEDGSDVKIVATSIDSEGPSIDLKTTETEQDRKGSKFKMPHLGFATSKVKGPTIDLTLSKKDVDGTLPEANTDVKPPEVSLGKVEVLIPEAKLEVRKPDLEMHSEGELSGQGKKLKFGIKMPKIKESEIDLSLSKKDIDITLPQTNVKGKLQDAPVEVSIGKADVFIPEAKAEVKKPELEIKPLKTEVEGQGNKFKMPKFGMSMPKVKGPEIHLGISKKDVDVRLPEAKADVNVELKEPSANAEIKAPEIEVVAKETKGSPSKFKMPNLSFSMPKVKGPDRDLSLSKKETDITLPGTQAEVKLPEAAKIDASLGNAEVLIPEAKVKVKKPEVEIKLLKSNIELEGQGGKSKKFEIKMPKVKGPEIDLNFSKKDVDMTLPEAKAEVKLPEAPKFGVDMKPPECEAEIDGQESKFEMSMPKVKGPETDLTLSKKHVDITLPEAELKEPSAEVEIKASEIEAQLSSVKGSPSKFKLPTFKFPKFGIGTPNVSAEVPDVEKEINIDGADMQISVPHKDVGVPEVKAKVIFPDANVKEPTEGVVIEKQLDVEVDGKLKKSRFSLPRFSFSKPSVKAPEFDVILQDANVANPDGKVEVQGEGVDIKLPECVAEIDGQGSKFKMPKFGITMPKVTGPEFDLSLSKKDVDVTLPEAKAEVKVPAVELKEPSAEVKIKAPEIKVVTKDKEGSPSKFKMPTFKLPTIGVGPHSAIVEVPNVDIDVKIDGDDVKIPEQVLAIDIAAPCIVTEGPSIDMKSTETEPAGKGSKFKMPKFGITIPKAKGPEFDLRLSKKDVDVTLPEAKTEVVLPDDELKEPSAEVKIQAPEIKVVTKDKEGSPSKLKMPTFKLPKFGVGTPSAIIEVPKVEKDVKIKSDDVKIPEEVLAVDIATASVDTKGPSIDIKTTETEHAGRGSKFKVPKFGITIPKVTGPEFDLGLSKKDVDVTLPEAKAEVVLPDVELKEPFAEVKIQAPEIKVVTKDTEGSPSKFNMPTFKLPKFEVGTPSATVEVPKVEKDVKIKSDDVKIPEEVLAVDIATASMDTKGPSIDIKTTETEHAGKGSKFKVPKFGITIPKVTGPEFDLGLSKKDVDVTLPEAKAEVVLPDVEQKEPFAEVKIQAPEIKVVTKDAEGSPSKFKMPTFKLPKFEVGTPSATVEVPKVEKDVKINGDDVKIPEGVLAVDIATASMDTKGPSIDIKTTETEHAGKGNKFKVPKFGITMPKVTGPKFDSSSSKKDVDVTLLEAKAEVVLPDVEQKEPSAEMKIQAPAIKVVTKDKEGSPSKLKMPTFKLPKFGVGIPSATVEVPKVEKDVKIDGDDVKIPKQVLAIDIAAPCIVTEGPSIDMKITETEPAGKGSKFKMPKFGITMPKAKGPEFDLSLSKKDVDVTLPEAKAEVVLPDVKLKVPSAEVKIQAPEIKVVTKDTEGSPSKFKMPTFKLPKIGVGPPSATVEVPKVEKDVKIDGDYVKIPEEVLAVDIAAASMDTKGPLIDIKTTETEHAGKGSKFKMPKFGITMPKITGPEFDLSSSKKDVDVTLPEAKAEVMLPDVELKEPFAEVKIQAPEIKVVTKDKEGSPSKFKMPTFKLPEFGVGIPSATVEVPKVEKDVKIDGDDVKIPEQVLAVDIAAPCIVTEGPSIDMKITETEPAGKGSKFKMPKFGITMPKAKGPEFDLSLSKKDVDVTLPEAKAEVMLPDVELKEPFAEVKIQAPEIKVVTKDKEGSPSKFKMPTFKLPKFGVGIPSATLEVPKVEKDVKIDGDDVKIPEQVLAVDIAAPCIVTEGPSIDMKTTETEHAGKGSKFKMPKFGITMPKVTGPEFDLSSSKKDVNVTLPEAKAEVMLPDVELKEPAEVNIQAPEIKVVTKDKEGSPSRFKMPSFKIPKFGVGTPSATIEVPKVEKDVKIDGDYVEIPKEVLAVDIAAPCIVTEGPSIDAPKLAVTLPETKTDLHLPDINIKESSGISIEGAPVTDLDAKLKKQRFSLPKFSFSKQSTKEPEVDSEVVILPDDVSLPKVNVKVKQPDVELKPPEGDVELDGQESKFKMSKFGNSMTKVKGPEINLNSSKKDIHVTLPEAKAKVTLPKFGAATPNVSVEVPDFDKDIKTDGAKLRILKEGATMDVTTPSIDTEGLLVDVKAKGSELEGSGSKFKMPKFGISMPKVKGPEIDLSLSKKDIDVTLPESKAEVKRPDAKVKEPEGTISIPDAPTVEVDANLKRPNWTFSTFSFSRTGGGKAPDVDVNLETPKLDVTSPETKTEICLPDVEVKGPSGAISMEEPPTTDLSAKLKKTKFSLPRFLFSKASVKEAEVSAELPYVDVSLPVENVEVKQPDVDIKSPENDVKLDGQESKFKMPKFGISMPKIKGPEIDLSLSKKDMDVTLPEAKAGVQLLDVKIKQPSAKVEIKAPEIEGRTGNIEGSLSKHKMPTFTLPKFGAASPKVSVEVHDVDKDIKTDGAKLEIFKEGAILDVTAPIIDTEGLSVDVKAKGSELEGSGSKFKMPKFGISMPKVEGSDIDLSLSKKDIDVTLPESKAEVKLLDDKVKEPEGTISIPDAPTVEVEAKLKRLNWTFPKFVFSRTGGGKAPDVDVNLEATGPEEDLNASQKDVDIILPEAKAEVKLPEFEVKESSASVEMKASEMEAKSKDVGGSPSKFKMPTVKMPKFGGATYVTIEAPDADKVAETDGDKLKESVTVNLKSVDIKTDVSKAAIRDFETPQTETDSVGLGSPSKFKLPSFKMPKLSFSRPKPEEEYVPDETEFKKDQLEMEVEPKPESKSPKMTFPSFGEILKNVDVEFDVPKVEEHLEISKKVPETEEPSGKQLETKEKQTNTKQDILKSPESTGWFKFPKFGLSSPSEPAKISEKENYKDKKSSAGEIVDEEISPTCSVQSSDAFADISSAMTSEHVGLSLSSPTKVTVRYSDPNTATGLGESHSNIITSTTRTEVITVEPNLPEKITILSSGVSSSSEDTLRLESGKIHVITSNIQATPEAQQAKLQTAVQVQLAGGLPLKSEANEATLWTVEDSQSGKRTVFERHLVRETSSERSESKETIVITKQVTHKFDSSVSGETASSIQRLKDSVHSEKMRFFDGAEK